jgi:uncharacterized damage-inducible protein DinB
MSFDSSDRSFKPLNSYFPYFSGIIMAEAAVTDNLYYLKQAASMVEGLSIGQYTHANPPAYANGIGPHLRHCLDHYELFTAGWREGTVDYDQRPRRDLQQKDPSAMLGWISDQSKALTAISIHDFKKTLKVKMDCGSEMEDPWSASSVLRELQFLISHTVHHFALIAMILRDQGLSVPEGFGVAPSTLKYEAELTACVQ